MLIHRVAWVGFASAAVVLAILASIAFAPQLLAPQSLADNPGTNPDTTQQPLPSAVEVPVWAVGNRWVYSVSLTTDGYEWTARILHGQIAEEVTAIEAVEGAGAAYNVSVSGTFEFDPGVTKESGTSLFHERPEIRFMTASVDGYTLFRTENLARLLDVRTVRLEGTKSVPVDAEHGIEVIAHTSLVLHLRATYEPAWDHWSFPIEENEMWTVKTNASVEGLAVFRADVPDGWIEIGKRFSFEVPLVYMVKSGTFEDVETPAGAFRAIGTAVERSLGSVPMKDDLAMAVELAHVERIPHGSVETWFSPDARNVVLAVVTVSRDEMKAVQLEVILVSYNLG